MARKIVSIRVEDKTTLIVHMDYGNAVPVVYGCVRVPTPKGAVEDGMIVDVIAISRRIKKACADKGIRTKDAVFTIASSKIANREVAIPAVAKSKIQPLVEAKATDYFPVDTEKYIFTYSNQERVEETEEGKMMNLLVFAAPNQLIQSYYALAEALDFHVLAIDCDGNSIFQIMKRQVKTGVAMAVQINRLNTLVNIMDGDKLLLQRAVPYGIGAVTDAMMADSVFQVKSFEEAYTLLTSRQVLMPTLEVTESMDISHQKRMEVTESISFLISNISRIIEYYNSKYKEKQIEEIICTGTGASAVGIHELFFNSLGIKTTTPDKLLGIKFARKIASGRNLLQYVGCFGAVMAPVHFIPKDVVDKEKKRGSAFSMAVVFLASALLCLVLAGFSFLQLYDAKTENERLISEETRLQPIEARYMQLMQTDASYKLCLALEDFVEAPNNELRRILRDVSKECPKNFRINSVASTETEVTINATTSDRLSSISVFKMKLDKITGIEKTAVATIAETRNEVTKKREYTYSIAFQYRDAIQ